MLSASSVLGLALLAGPASSGATELDAQGKAVEKPAGPAADATDATQFDLSLGGILATGNSRSFAGTGAAKFLLRRKIHQFGAQAAGNYGRAALVGQDEWNATAANGQGRVRYDVFVAKRWSVYTVATARHDRFQGLDLRLNIGPGVGFYALTDPKHALWWELGYDFQFDRRWSRAVLAKDAGGNLVLDQDGRTIALLSRNDQRHAARLFMGYSNKLDERISFDVAVEYLQSVVHAQQIRLNADVGLAVQLRKRLALATTFTLRFDNAPLPDVRKVDTVSALSLVYRVL
jgi:putative salt-induced outer membrane protein